MRALRNPAVHSVPFIDWMFGLGFAWPCRRLSGTVAPPLPQLAVRSGSQVISFELAVAPDDKHLLEPLRKLLDARKTVMRTT
jgi:hypothetical protein